MAHRVLIVEDEPTVRAHLAESIRAHPHLDLVGEATTLAEGIDALAEARPDVMLIDLGLPDGSGIDLIRLCGEAIISSRTLAKGCWPRMYVIATRGVINSSAVTSLRVKTR